MSTRLSLALAFLAILFGFSGCKKENPLAKLLPDLEGFERSELKSCSQVNDANGLSECLDGFAEKVLPLGVIGQVQQQYQFPASCKPNPEGGKDCSRTFGVYVTDFNTEDGAFGYYTISRTPPVKSVRGIKQGEAYLVAQRDNGKFASADIYVWKGKHVFQLVIDDAKDVKMAKALAGKLALAVPGSGNKPAALKFLPENHRLVPDSQTYMAVDFPLYEEVKNVVEAEYSAANKLKYRMFLADLSAPERAKEVFSGWKKFAATSAKDLKEHSAYQLNGFSYSSGIGEIQIVFSKGKYVFGVYGKGIVAPDQGVADLSDLLQNLP